MAKSKDIAGENWGVCGKMNTGKTHSSMELAMLIQERSGKPIVVFDHTNNSSYSGIDLTIEVDDLRFASTVLQEYETYRVLGCSDNEEFLGICQHYVRNTVIILDDCSNYMVGNLSEVQMAFVTSSKNNGNDVFYQFHSINDIAPKLCRNLQMIVVKEQATTEIPQKMPSHQLIQILHDQVRHENNFRDPEELWAYRIYDIYRDRVFYEKPTGEVVMEHGREYFKKFLNSKKR